MTSNTEGLNLLQNIGWKPLLIGLLLVMIALYIAAHLLLRNQKDKQNGKSIV